MAESIDSDAYAVGILVWAAGLAAPPLTLVLPAVYYAWAPTKRALANRAKRKAEERKEAQRLAAEVAERERLRREAEEYRKSLPPPPPPPPPPPTAERLRAAAKERFESTIRSIDSASLTEAEKHHAREVAKQTFFRELDRLMAR